MVAKFDPKELEKKPGQRFGRPIELFSCPLNQHDADEAFFKKEAWWQMYQASDTVMFNPHIIPDNIARGFVFEAEMGKYMDQKGGPDMFGVEWEWVEQVGGSMVRPGKPYLEEIEEWREKIVWPDVDSWDWEGCAKANNGTFLKKENFNQLWFFTGYYERLIAFMEFENAIMAIFDEDCQEEVHAFFERLTELYLDILKHVCDYFPDVNAIFFHDDWGSQKETFFSPAVVEEMIVPYMKRITDYLHSRGVWCELHSCGNNYKQIPNMIKAGWDMWAPQLMNDCYKIYDDYGDQIIIATYPMNIPEEIQNLRSEQERGEAFAKLPEEEQRRIAREYVHRVNKIGKPSSYSFYASHWLTPAVREELYVESRKIFSGEIEP